MAREIASFAVIGLINTAVDFLVLNLLLFIGSMKAKVVATIVATTLSYVMNRYWTFARRERTGVGQEYLLFFALNLVGLGIQLIPFGITKYLLDYSATGGVADRIAFNLANVLGIAIAMVFRFWSYRTFVFKAVSTEQEKILAENFAFIDMSDAEKTKLEFEEITRPMADYHEPPVASLISQRDESRSPSSNV